MHLVWEKAMVLLVLLDSVLEDSDLIPLGFIQMISLHDGFKSGSSWFGFLEGADRVALDSHFYLAFREPNDEALLVQALKVRFHLVSFFSNPVLHANGGATSLVQNGPAHSTKLFLISA